MPTTPDGYRYPAPGDAASALDTYIGNLATDVDNANRRGTLAARPLASAVFPGTRYTVTSGASVGQVSICAPDPGAGGANAWWPLATEGHTHTGVYSAAGHTHPRVWTGVKVSRFTQIPVPTGGSGLNPVPFETEDYDSDGFFNAGASTTTLTIPAGLGGWYDAEALFIWTTVNSGVRSLRVTVDTGAGFVIRAAHIIQPGATSASPYNVIAEPLLLNAGDQVRLQATHDKLTDENSSGIALPRNIAFLTLTLKVLV